MADTNIYVPKQKTNRGKAGYRGANVVVVDQETGAEKPAEKAKGGKK